MPRLAFAIALSLLIGQSAAAAAPASQPTQTWELTGPGEFKQVQSPDTQPIANPTLDKVEQLLVHHRFNSARKIVLDWLKHHKDAPDRDRALFLLAEAYDQYGDRIRAFYHLDELLDTYPESRLFYPALEKQYEIGDAFLRGYRRRFLGLPILTSEDEGVEILYRIQERSPGSPLAERALLRTADHYFASSDFDLAFDAYASYARSYPRSPDIPRVRMRQALSSYAQFRGLLFDATPLIDAKAQLEDIARNYPELAAEENVPDVIERINRSLAGKIYRTADFYVRTHDPRGAVYTYRYLIQTYPETREAVLARNKLERMPAWALTEPGPSSALDSLPDSTTRPATRAAELPSVPREVR